MSSAAGKKKNQKVDMSTKIGGRVMQPALPVVDATLPGGMEESFHATLAKYCDDHIPIESKEGIQTRERVLNRMGAVCREWIRSVCIQRGLPSDVVDAAGGQLFTSGSYRLGVHEPGADIDTILVAPLMCTRQDFFGEILTEESTEDHVVRDPNSLAERIRTHPDVTNFVPVEGAAVPILTFDWEGINIDLLFARLNSNSILGDFDINNDAVLDGVDSATEKSINGPRVTNLIAALVSGTEQRYQTFLTVVRCVRKWAKARGLYSNKMGYWGGVNINIAVALCVQLYPLATPANLLRKFFLVFKTWRWPNPVMLTKPHDAGYGLPVWSATNVHNARQVAPIITPAYPAMNSTLSVSRQTLQIMHEEFCRGHDIVSRLWKQHEQKYQRDPTSVQDLNWSELFEPSNFFIAYPHYLSLCIVGPTQADAQAWAGFVESRLRKLVSDLLGRSLPLSKIQLWPKKFEACIADRGALLTQAQRKNCITYFVGFQVDKLRMRGTQLNIEQQLLHFREWDLSRFQPLVPGMDICAKTFPVKNLPKICFDGIYGGGKLEAMKKRREVLDADPKRQEKKRLKRLKELKEKMAEIQRQKEVKAKEEQKEKELQDEIQNEIEQQIQVKMEEEDDAVDLDDEEGTSKKRKRKDDGDDEELLVKEELLDVENKQGEEAADEEVEEETDLLESALDTIQDAAFEGEHKTREEAEADKRKLLEGELLDDEPYESDDDDGYTGDYRDSLVPARSALAKKEDNAGKRNKHHLPIPSEDAELLRQIGIIIVSDDETQIIGGNMLPPGRQAPSATAEDDSNDGKRFLLQRGMKIQFQKPFDVVELDAHGHVVDTGDEDFTPSNKWIGRKAGFEFKLGLRGLGYYRTGKKVVVPSNCAY